MTGRAAGGSTGDASNASNAFDAFDDAVALANGAAAVRPPGPPVRAGSGTGGPAAYDRSTTGDRTEAAVRRSAAGSRTGKGSRTEEDWTRGSAFADGEDGDAARGGVERGPTERKTAATGEDRIPGVPTAAARARLVHPAAMSPGASGARPSGPDGSPGASGAATSRSRGSSSEALEAPGARSRGSDAPPEPSRTARRGRGSASPGRGSPAQAGGSSFGGSSVEARTTSAPLPPRNWGEARAIARRAARPLAPINQFLDRAHEHVLAVPLTALTDLPSFDTSAMDGWAVAGPGPWALSSFPGAASREADGSIDAGTGTGADGRTAVGILAGHAEPPPLADGHAVPIATGARIPAGATAVLRSEHGEVSPNGARLRAHHQPPPGKDIRPRGQECRSGDELVPAATPVTPAVLGLAAAAGYDELTVTPRPRVEVLVLGEELLRRGRPRDGLIRDALGPMIAPWLDALGAHTLVTRRLGDDAEALHEAVSTSTADLIVTTGGTASGPVDHVHPILRRIGATLLVDGVAVRPGHPMLLAGLPTGKHLVGLPGNPLAAVSGLLTLAEPLLRTLANRPDPSPTVAALSTDVAGHPRDTRLIPVTRQYSRGTRMVVRPLLYAGPAMLRGIATATALAVVPPGGVTSGAEVQLLRLPWA